ncbi:hypothetical protein A4A49_04544 [Nicotiana attenuata]|uniref:Uncharacterized protein n=1 Tax=Nicotiana attenuata TaxID=49451 RepID=A0A314KX92_NICAT|nr:hypothetical protein A4A49_04544 [Nicotiana attenuata]
MYIGPRRKIGNNTNEQQIQNSKLEPQKLDHDEPRTGNQNQQTSEPQANIVIFNTKTEIKNEEIEALLYIFSVISSKTKSEFATTKYFFFFDPPLPRLLPPFHTTAADFGRAMVAARGRYGGGEVRRGEGLGHWWSILGGVELQQEGCGDFGRWLKRWSFSPDFRPVTVEEGVAALERREFAGWLVLMEKKVRLP